MKATVKYIGQSEYAKEDRFAVITTSAENEEKVMDILNESGWAYDVVGDYEETVFYVEVEDKDDYKDFMSYWKKAKKTA